MSKSAGFNIEDIITPLKGGEGDGNMEEPRVEQLIGQLRKLQQGKEALEGEIKEIKAVNDSLQKELATLRFEAYQLEGIHKEKEETCRVLQFQCDLSERDSARQLQLNKKIEELLEQHRRENQELKVKHRKLRMKFENQLHQLIEQHKNLHSVFTPERLPAEVESVENGKSQLLAAEQLKLTQLQHLGEALEEVKKLKQQGTTAAEIEGKSYMVVLENKS